MATDDADPGVSEDLSPQEARERLLRLIAEDDMEEHEQIYEALARE
jgi:hypothetical protein